MFAAAVPASLEKNFLVAMNVRAIHTIPHSGIDFAQAQAVARELSLPFFISLHDDLAYTAAAEVSAAAANQQCATHG